MTLGSHARNTGALQIYELEGSEAKLVTAIEKPQPLKCGTFGASALSEGKLATGDFEGNLDIW
ncbi:MAG: hypothetical protein AAF202_11405 [Pseudomonadota bacterium]